MLPLNILSEITRTFSLMVRLFGNVMSGEFIIALVLSLAGLFVPIPLMALEILLGLVQAYIFTVLATVFIGAAVGDAVADEETPKETPWTIEMISIIARRVRRIVRRDRPGARPKDARSPPRWTRSPASRKPPATISRTLFVGLAMIETTAIYCLVIALLLLFANPYVG